MRELSYNTENGQALPEPVVAVETRESRVSKRRSVQLQAEVESRQLSPEELELQAELIRPRRKMEELEGRLTRMQDWNDNELRARITTAGVCQSIDVQQPAKKKTRLNGQGREEAIVLNSDE